MNIPNWRDWKSCKDYSFLFTTSRPLTSAERKALMEQLRKTVVDFTKERDKLPNLPKAEKRIPLYASTT